MGRRANTPVIKRDSRSFWRTCDLPDLMCRATSGTCVISRDVIRIHQGIIKSAYVQNTRRILVTPYYEDDYVTLFCADAASVTLPLSGAVLILDPPFDEWHGVSSYADVATTVAFTNLKARPMVEALLGQPRTELIWHFADGRWVSHALPRITHEYIMVYGDTGECYVGDATDQTPRKKGKSSIGRWTSDHERVYTPRPRKALNSVLAFPRNVSSPLGCWSKPLPLMTQLLEWVGDEQQVIIDPYAGAGTTLLAAKQLRRKAIGVEINPEHCAMAAKRLRDAEPPLFSLFDKQT